MFWTGLIIGIIIGLLIGIIVGMIYEDAKDVIKLKDKIRNKKYKLNNLIDSNIQIICENINEFSKIEKLTDSYLEYNKPRIFPIYVIISNKIIPSKKIYYQNDETVFLDSCLCEKTISIDEIEF
jgi:hypothetical protein